MGNGASTKPGALLKAQVLKKESKAVTARTTAAASPAAPAAAAAAPRKHSSSESSSDSDDAGSSRQNGAALKSHAPVLQSKSGSSSIADTKQAAHRKHRSTSSSSCSSSSASSRSSSSASHSSSSSRSSSSSSSDDNSTSKRHSRSRHRSRAHKRRQRSASSSSAVSPSAAAPAAFVIRDVALRTLFELLPLYAGNGVSPDPTVGSALRAALAAVSPAAVDTRDESGATLLCRACQYGAGDLVAPLLSRYATVFIAIISLVLSIVQVLFVDIVLL
jgi:hypothetical protein